MSIPQVIKEGMSLRAFLPPLPGSSHKNLKPVTVFVIEVIDAEQGIFLVSTNQRVGKSEYTITRRQIAARA